MSMHADKVVAQACELAPLRACVNSAGLGAPGRTIDRNNVPLDLEKFSFVIQVNLIGTFNVLSRAAAAMAKQEEQQTNSRNNKKKKKGKGKKKVHKRR